VEHLVSIFVSAASACGRDERDERLKKCSRERKIEQEEAPVARIEVYTTRYCPYCTRAKALLRSKGLEFHEIDVTDNSELRMRMVELSGGRRTVPEIFINGEIIGGCDELYQLEMSGELDALLASPA
jgi:glutaredoxin 3